MTKDTVPKHGTDTATTGEAVERDRGEPLRLRCDKESEGYEWMCKRHCPQGNEMDATEKHSPALAKRGTERHWLGLAMIGSAEAWTCKDCYGTALIGRAEEKRRIGGRWKCIALATERQNNVRQGNGMASQWQGAEEPRRRREGKVGQRVEMAKEEQDG